MHTTLSRTARILLGLFLLVFGVMTLKEGGSVIFVDGPDRAAAGHYVPFVVWFNFLAGFTYLATAAGLLTKRSWARILAVFIAGATLLCFVAFGGHIALGGLWEKRTLFAMTLRTGIWLLVAWQLSRRSL